MISWKIKDRLTHFRETPQNVVFFMVFSTYLAPLTRFQISLLVFGWNAPSQTLWPHQICILGIIDLRKRSDCEKSADYGFLLTSPVLEPNREHANYYGENFRKSAFGLSDSYDTSIDVHDLQLNREHANYYGGNFRKSAFCLVILTTLV